MLKTWVKNTFKASVVALALLHFGCWNSTEAAKDALSEPSHDTSIAKQPELALFSYTFNNLNEDGFKDFDLDTLSTRGFSNIEIAQLKRVKTPENWYINQDHLFTPKSLPLSLSLSTSAISEAELHWKSTWPIVLFSRFNLPQADKYKITITLRGMGYVQPFIYVLGSKAVILDAAEEKIQWNNNQQISWTIDAADYSASTIRVAIALSGNLYLNTLEVTGLVGE